MFAIEHGYIEALEGMSHLLNDRATRLTLVGSVLGPGLGIEINEELVRETAVKYAGEKPWRNEIFHGPDGAFREW